MRMLCAVDLTCFPDLNIRWPERDLSILWLKRQSGLWDFYMVSFILAASLTSSSSTWFRLQIIRESVCGMALFLWGPCTSRKPVFCRDSFRDHWCHAADLHVLVHGSVSGELGLTSCHFQVEVVDSECDHNDEGQNKAQDEGEGLFQAFPLISDALVGCVRRKM